MIASNDALSMDPEALLAAARGSSAVAVALAGDVVLYEAASALFLAQKAAWISLMKTKAEDE